ncbi:MAG: sigma-70 family RNA polymerase sigma factor [Deltaproteobacteria bacterium]|nr:sigma-70 family RNA polymerase sigma factor [Deltaproteobacteria bacterium]
MTTLAQAHGMPLATPTVTDVYRAHRDFVWASLQRMGVRDADLPDQFQEVFIVVHRRLDSFEGRSAMTTWLFGICLRVAAGYRRKGCNKREVCISDDELSRRESPALGPEQRASQQESRALAQRVLDAMDIAKRAVLVMFEIEELSCEEISRSLGVPVGTVYSRLHAARAQFESLHQSFEPRTERRTR